MMRWQRRRSRPRPRDLRRELRRQSAEEYWSRRQNPRFRHLRNTWRTLRMIRSALLPLLLASGLGLILLGVAMVGELYLARHIWSPIVPDRVQAPSLGALPVLAVQVTASLLGFYLASVSIVLGNSYRDASADIRELVLGSPRVRRNLAWVGAAIGGGLFLVLLQGLEFQYGYLTISIYILIIAFSGRAFVNLAYGAFSLFDPTELSIEPLIGLSRAINRLDSKKIKGNETFLRVDSRRANRSLLILAELIAMTRNRVSVDRGRLATMVSSLLLLVRHYARLKHVLPPSSTWFVRELVYPKWVEESHSATSLALGTSTSLQPRREPSSDWLERRSAELTSAAMEACATADDRDSVLLITDDAARTAETLARYHRIDDAVAFSKIIRERCQLIKEQNSASVATAIAPPLILGSLLLGWRQAISKWPDEIQSVADETKWNNRGTAAVRIRGSRRVWEAAQKMLLEVKAEQEVQGERVTPNWYLTMTLADSSILSIRETASELPRLLEDFLLSTTVNSSAEVKVLSGLQALQTLSKAQLVYEALPQAIEGLESLRQGNERNEITETEGLHAGIRSCTAKVLESISEALPQLHPERSKSEPDLFGEALFRILHHTEEAVREGNNTLAERVFPRLLQSTLVLQEYLPSAYQPPTYEVSSSLFDPTIDILELSGLAIIYASLRNDHSDEPIRQAWAERLMSTNQPKIAAQWILGILDLEDGSPSLGMSARSMSRSQWAMRLSKVIEERGYAPPEYHPFVKQQPWSAPPLIKLLGPSEYGGRFFLEPRAIFVAEVIGPLSGEGEDTLRNRAGLREYYERRDRYFEQKTKDNNGS